MNHVTDIVVGGRARRSANLRVLEQPLALADDWEMKPGVPATRLDCPTSRPCPYVRCRYHLWLTEAEARPGRRHKPGEGGAPSSTLNPATPATCALEVAESGGHTFHEIGAFFGVTDERARKIFQRAARKIAALGYTIDDLLAMRDDR